MSKIPTAEEILGKQGVVTSPVSGLQTYLPENAKTAMIEFAKLHVKAALKEYKSLQKMKYMAGETGYLKEEDWNNAYPDNLIQ